MNRKNVKKGLYVLTCSALLAGILYNPTAQKVSAGSQTKTATDFFTSFEEENPQPTWKNQVETDAKGKKMSSGIDGNIQYDGI